MAEPEKIPSPASRILVLFLLLLPGGANGQVAVMEPTEELRRLEAFIGVWTRRSQESEEPCLRLVGPDRIHEEVWRSPDGGAWTKQSQAEWRKVTGSWSADTATILYTSQREGNGELFLQRGRGSGAGGAGGAGGPRNLTRHPGPDGGGRWFPGGGRIAFHSVRDGNFEVYLIALDGSGDAVNLTNDPAHDLLPEPSPDGTRVLFFSTRGEARGPRGEFVGNLWLIGAEGNGLVRLTAEPLSSSFGGAWSPDGETVLFARDLGGNVELFAMNADGTGERRLTHRPGADYGGRFSPDGRLIAFHTEEGEESRIAVMNADGSAVRVLTRGGLHYGPSWSPDGAWILFTAAPVGGEVYDLLMVPVTGGAMIPVVATDADERSGAWAPVR